MKALPLVFIFSFFFLFQASSQFNWDINEWDSFDCNTDEVVIIDNFVENQFVAANMIQSNCHGYAHRIVFGLSHPNPEMTPSEINTALYKKCSKAESTHIWFYSAYGHCHSAIWSQFACYPAEEEWIQHMNGLYPGVHLSKLNDVLFYVPSVVRYEYRKYIGDEDFINPTKPKECYNNCDCENVPIFGANTLPINTGAKYNVNYCKTWDYEWAVTSSPGAYDLMINASKPYECYLSVYSAGTYRLESLIKDGNNISIKVKDIKVGKTPLLNKSESLNVENNSTIKVSSFTVYPNPPENEITCLFEGFEKEIRIIEIMDMQGRIRNQIKMIDHFNEKIKIDISDLSPGIYFVILKTDKESMVQKIAKH